MEQLSLFDFQLLGVFFCPASEVLSLRHSLFIAAFQVLHIHLAYRVEMGFSTHLYVLHFLELLLPFPQEIQIVACNYVADSRLLSFHVVVCRFI